MARDIMRDMEIVPSDTMIRFVSIVNIFNFLVCYADLLTLLRIMQ